MYDLQVKALRETTSAVLMIIKMKLLKLKTVSRIEINANTAMENIAFEAYCKSLFKFLTQ